MQAQTFAEWFSQKKTQKKYLIQQISELQVYLGYLKKGYDISKQGLGTIRQIKNGEFDLHSVFYQSLKTVNPRVKQYPQVESILDNCQYISTAVNSLKKLSQQSPNYLSANDKDLLQTGCNNLLSDVDKTIGDLLDVLADNRLEMTDDARLRRINEIFTHSQDQMAFTGQFSGDNRLYMLQKQREAFDQAFIKKLYDLK